MLSQISKKLCNKNLWKTFILFLICSLGKQFILSCLLLIALLHVGHGGPATIVLIILSFIAFLRFLENNLLYHNNEPANSRYFVDHPPSYHLHNYESVYFHSHSHRLHAYLIKSPHGGDPSALPTLLFCHGNAGNMGHRLMNINHLVLYCHVNVCIFDYRGYGLSRGTPSESGIYEDARACLRYLLSRGDIDHAKIILFGRSLGGAVAIQLASEAQFAHNIRAVIVENTFTSVPAMSRSIFNIPIMRSIPDWLLLNQFNSLAKISLVKQPILFISGTQDTLVPPEMMMKLFHTCKSNKKEIRHFPAGHNDTWTCSNYRSQIRYFIHNVLSQTVPRSPTNALEQTVLHL